MVVETVCESQDGLDFRRLPYALTTYGGGHRAVRNCYINMKTQMAYPYDNANLWFLFSNTSSLRGKVGLCEPAPDGVPPKGYRLFEEGEFERLLAAAQEEN